VVACSAKSWPSLAQRRDSEHAGSIAIFSDGKHTYDVDHHDTGAVRCLTATAIFLFTLGIVICSIWRGALANSAKHRGTSSTSTVLVLAKD